MLVEGRIIPEKPVSQTVSLKSRVCWQQKINFHLQKNQSVLILFFPVTVLIRFHCLSWKLIHLFFHVWEPSTCSNTNFFIIFASFVCESFSFVEDYTQFNSYMITSIRQCCHEASSRLSCQLHHKKLMVILYRQ